MHINTFDIDGVIFMGKDLNGVYPGRYDVIITGRSFEEEPETMRMLHSKGITNFVYFNPLPFDEKTRESSGLHKANVIRELQEDGYQIGIHFEDDEIQANVVREMCPNIHVVRLQHNLVPLENVRHA